MYIRDESPDQGKAEVEIQQVLHWAPDYLY